MLPVQSHVCPSGTPPPPPPAVGGSGRASYVRQLGNTVSRAHRTLNKAFSGVTEKDRGLWHHGSREEMESF